MVQYNVTGMSCAACSARVEKAVLAVEGVESCSVSLLTNSMGVEGCASEDSIIKAVTDAGYGATVKGNNRKSSSSDNSELQDTETPKMKKRLFVSVGFLLILMYFSMGHMLWNWPLPGWLDGNHVSMGILEMLLTVIIMVINQKFFVSGFKGAINGAPNMDTLVALGASASFIWSVVVLFIMSSAQMSGDEVKVLQCMDQLYFESAAMILTLITIGKTLEAFSKGKTTDALKNLISLTPKTANVIKNGNEIEVSIDDVKVGDVFIVRAGQSIPVDGFVMEGNGSVNESALSGESIPVDKEEGDKVSAATILQSGFIKCQAERVGEDTTLSQIIALVSDAASTKAPIARIADKVSGYFVPVVISIAFLTIVGWLIAGREFSYALARGISVLVISCPCALGLATPVAIMVGNGVGAKNGILFKTAVSLEELGKADNIVLDKTGTITNGLPVVDELYSDASVGDEMLIKYASSLESKSEHPIAKAIVEKGKGSSLFEVNDYKTYVGNGVSGLIDNELIYAGSVKFVSSKINVGQDYITIAQEYSGRGGTPVVIASEEKVYGVISVADSLKTDSKDAIDQLKNMGINVVMLTGDNSRTAKTIADSVGIETVISDVLPNQKEEVVRKLQKSGKTIMVGDGINDAPALTRADIGVAIGAGADVAIDAADVVLVKGSLMDVAAAVRLSRATLKNIHENLFWAFFYNVIGIPVAIGLFSGAGIILNPMICAAAMSLSSFFVVTNALRLNLTKVYDSSKDKKKNLNKISNEEEKTMTKTMKIEGMMCPHCEKAVKTALEELAEVESAEVSHEAGTAVVTLNTEVDNDLLKQTVEAKDYKVISVE